MVRQSVWVTWAARRWTDAAWPAWGRMPEVVEGVVQFAPARETAAQVASAVGVRLSQAGAVFGCGVSLDDEGREQEAACEIVSMRVLACPSPWDGETGKVMARVEVDSEAVYGPNSFAWGRELADRLGPADWRYAPGGVARLDVTRIDTDGMNAGRVRIYPPRDWEF